MTQFYVYLYHMRTTLPTVVQTVFTYVSLTGATRHLQLQQKQYINLRQIPSNSEAVIAKVNKRNIAEIPKANLTKSHIYN